MARHRTQAARPLPPAQAARMVHDVLICGDKLAPDQRTARLLAARDCVRDARAILQTCDQDLEAAACELVQRLDAAMWRNTR